MPKVSVRCAAGHETSKALFVSRGTNNYQRPRRLTCVSCCRFLAETEGCRVHREDRGAEGRRSGEGLLRRNRANVGEQDEVGEGEEPGADVG